MPVFTILQLFVALILICSIVLSAACVEDILTINIREASDEELLKADEDLVENSSDYNPENKRTWKSTIKDDKLNPLKRKPKGIYDCDTIYEFFCELLYDYGVNIDFYGDPNGIPIFEIVDLETWKKDVYIFSPRRGFENEHCRCCRKSSAN